MSIAFRLRIKSPNGKQKTVVVQKEEVIVGRDNACDIKINDPEISRRHASLKLYSVDRMTLTDLGSSNGTYLRNSPITQETRISPGTIVRLGNSFITIEIQGGFQCQVFDHGVSNDEYQSISHFLDHSSTTFESYEQHLFDCFSDLISTHAGIANPELMINRIADVLSAENGLIVLNPSGIEAGRAIRVTRGDIVHYPGNIFDAVLAHGNCILLPSFATTQNDNPLKKMGIGSAMCSAIVESGKSIGAIYLDRGADQDLFNQNDLNILCHLAALSAIRITHDLRDLDIQRKLRGLESERNKWFDALSTRGEPPVQSQNRKYQQVLFIAMRLGRSNNHVFILGESGTGRSMLAQRVHVYSDRADEPFLSFNCLEPPRDRIPEILFGLDNRDHSDAGLLESAHGGTLYLQEITALSIEIQSRIARCLDDGWLTRENGSQKIAINTRIIVSSNVRPENMASETAFHPDLLAKTYPSVLHLPNLKDRQEDILPLAKYFLRAFLPNNRSIPDFNPKTAELMVRYNWPGNIEELKDTMRFTAAVCRENEVQIGDLPHKILEQPTSAAPSNLNLREQMDALETDLILIAMERNKNIVTKAAKALGLSESTLRYRMQRLQINL